MLFAVAVLVGAPSLVLVVPAALIGIVAIGHGLYRIRHHDWRTRDWWRARPWLASTLGGTILTEPNRLVETTFGCVQLIFGAGMLVLAAAIVASYF